MFRVSNNKLPLSSRPSVLLITLAVMIVILMLAPLD
jgi:hypothetical protein